MTPDFTATVKDALRELRFPFCSRGDHFAFRLNLRATSQRHPEAEPQEMTVGCQLFPRHIETPSPCDAVDLFMHLPFSLEGIDDWRFRRFVDDFNCTLEAGHIDVTAKNQLFYRITNIAAEGKPPVKLLLDLAVKAVICFWQKAPAEFPVLLFPFEPIPDTAIFH